MRRAAVSQPVAPPPVAPAIPAQIPQAAPKPSSRPASVHAQTPQERSAQRAVIQQDEEFVIPTGYGDHCIVAMVKDPWWLFAYWEIQPHIERQIKSRLAPEEIPGLQTVLRVYDVTGQPDALAPSDGVHYPPQPANSSFDVALSGLANQWYVHSNGPNRAFVIDIGVLTRRGRFLTLARSNRVTSPRFGPSDIIDEEWMVADEQYWRLYGMTSGIGTGSSPGALRKLLEHNLSSHMFSPGIYSHKVRPPTDRGFWFWVKAELIIYGATDPKAGVAIQGRSVKLKSDGSFGVRMELPDGVQTIPVEAISPDGVETRTITPIVNRKTEHHERVR